MIRGSRRKEFRTSGHASCSQTINLWNLLIHSLRLIFLGSIGIIFLLTLSVSLTLSNWFKGKKVGNRRSVMLFFEEQQIQDSGPNYARWTRRKTSRMWLYPSREGGGNFTGWFPDQPARPGDDQPARNWFAQSNELVSNRRTRSPDGAGRRRDRPSQLWAFLSRGLRQCPRSSGWLGLALRSQSRFIPKSYVFCVGNLYETGLKQLSLNWFLSPLFFFTYEISCYNLCLWVNIVAL
jgi:hypothetical protein